ncbi:MAG: C45 family peptidase [Candidatus Omnitrophota bacterium]
MKKIFLVLFGVSFFANVLFAAPSVKDEVLLTQGKDSYQSVRHIVITGTNEEIGKALGDIAQKEYGIKKLPQYPDAVYAQAMDTYMEAHSPILKERSKGVAESYNEKYEGSLSIFNELVYDAGPWGCSSVYYPPSLTEGGSGFLGHNMDYPMCSINKLLKLPEGNAPPMFTRNYVIELYPDKGYASIGVGTGDLLSVVSGMNEKGLLAVLHTDNYTAINTDPKTDISGLIYPTQILRYVLENCQTVDEAKKAILNQKLSLTFEPGHLLIADKSGRSVIVEINPKNMRVELTDNPGTPQIFTNHPIYRFKDPTTFPAYKPFEEDNTFARYNRLVELLGANENFSADDVAANQTEVVARWNNPGRGMANPTIPNRTIWTDIYDQKTGSLKVKFYLKDGPIDPVTGDPKDLVYSDFFTFKLQKEKM